MDNNNLSHNDAEVKHFTMFDIEVWNRFVKSGEMSWCLHHASGGRRKVDRQKHEPINPGRCHDIGSQRPFL